MAGFIVAQKDYTAVWFFIYFSCYKKSIAEVTECDRTIGNRLVYFFVALFTFICHLVLCGMYSHGPPQFVLILFNLCFLFIPSLEFDVSIVVPSPVMPKHVKNLDYLLFGNDPVFGCTSI